MELYLNDVYPYAQQISNYIEREIFQQKLKAGQKLLSITNLSKELNVSKHTIQLSYKILRKKELIVKKGNDFFVTKDNCCIITKMKEETDLQIIKCLHELAEMGYSREQTKSLILRKLDEKPSCKVRFFAQNRSRKYCQKVTATTPSQTAFHRIFQPLAQTAHVRFHG